MSSDASKLFQLLTFNRYFRKGKPVDRNSLNIAINAIGKAADFSFEFNTTDTKIA